MGVKAPATANVFIDATGGSIGEIAITGCTIQHTHNAPDSANIRTIGQGLPRPYAKDELRGGIYGLALGSMFFAESMFSLSTDASKIALVALCRQLHAWGFGMLDCQVGNPHLFRMGACQLGRDAFEDWLQHLVDPPRATGPWGEAVEFEARW